MKPNKTFIGFALDKNKKIIHIKDAKRGFGHGYKCPVCKKELGAKKGDVNEHHFAHKSGETHEGESVIHYVAKHELAKLLIDGSFEFRKRIQITGTENNECKINFPVSEKLYIRYLDKKPTDYLSPKNIIFKNVEVESSIVRELRPDVKAITSDGDLFGIEIFVTHSKDCTSIDKYKELDISGLEINLSHLSFDSTEQEIVKELNNPKNHRWFHISNNLKIIHSLQKSFLSSELFLNWLEDQKEIKKIEDKNRIPALNLDTVPTIQPGSVEQFRKKVKQESAELRESWGGEPVLKENEIKPAKKKHNPQTVIYKNKVKRSKKVKVKFVQSHPPYRSGQVTEIEEHVAEGLMKKFIVKPI